MKNELFLFINMFYFFFNHEDRSLVVLALKSAGIALHILQVTRVSLYSFMKYETIITIFKVNSSFRHSLRRKRESKLFHKHAFITVFKVF